MPNKFFRYFLLLIQIFTIAVEMLIYIYGILIAENLTDSLPLIVAVVRVAVVLLITITYYKTSVTKFNPGNLFIITCLFFLSASELGVLSYLVQITGWSILSPRTIARIVMASQFLSYFSIIGYAVQNQTNEHNPIVRLLMMGGIGVIFLTMTIPTSQDVYTLWSIPAPLILVTILAATACLTNLILIFSEPTRGAVARHLSIIFMIVGNYIVIKFGQNLIMAIIGSSLFIIGGLIIVGQTLHNSVLL